MKVRISTVALGVVFSMAIGSVSGTAEAAKPTDKKDKKVIVKVVSGDTLTKIADKHDTTYVRLFNANKKLESPDLINVGDKVRVPKDDEKLSNRYDKFRKSLATIVAPVAPAATGQQSAPTPAPAQPSRSYSAAPTPRSTPTPRGSTAGNTYAAGNCTWYVKSMRGDLPNMLGNGGSWVGNAAAQGFSTGSAPSPGAVAEQPGHVAYVQSVNGNMVTVSEMNYRGSPGGGFGRVSTRTVPASTFTYIY